MKLHRCSDWLGLVAECRRLLGKAPYHLESHRTLGFALHKLGRFEEARQAFQSAIQVYPDDAELLVNFANILVERSLPLDALALAEKACALRPELAVPWILKSMCFHLLWRHQEGLECAHKACELAKTDAQTADALNLRAIHRRELGETLEAIQDCESVIRMRPGDTRLRGNHLLFLLSAPGLTPEHLSAVAREHGAAIESAAGPWVRMGYQRKAENVSRRLRVGFLSPDFRVHSVMNFVEPLLARLDRTQFDVWSLYLMHQEDQVTARARQLSDHFVSLAGLSHDEKVRKLRSLELDIVIDLAGHSANNGLTLLAAQVAPVQASWGGFPSTTGMQSIQYRLTDHVTDPPDAENWYTEKLYRMKGLVCCYRPMIRRPLLRYQEKYYVQPSPALQNGFVTFGSCNNLSKLTDDVLKVWSRILRRVAGSKLLIEGKDLGKPEFASKFTARCKKTGIPEDSLVLVGLDPANQYLTYHRIDIALDPFPLTGGTTSFDALWMGVPLVTLEGEMFSSRMGTGLLTTIGRPEWISQTAEQYIEIAAELATDAVQLNDIRMTVRDSIERSPAMDEQLFAREFGEGLHHMWQAWVQSGQAPLLAAPVELPAAACEHAAAQHTLSGTSPIQVATSRGTRTCTSQAYVELQEGLAQAKAATPSELPLRDDMLMPEWRTVAEEAKLLMATLPGDPMALAVLAEVEMAHGNAAAAEHYMAWAVRHLAQQEGIR